ncbi:MAG: hypothetical protein ABSF92_02845 [Candidatus Acidiferrales bacterium]|jgi:hypothetical protein
MNDREYRRLRAEAEAEYKRKLEAIETVWKMSGASTSNGTGASGSSMSRGALLDAVRAAVKLIPGGDFTIKEVAEQIEHSNSALASRVKKASISGTLKRLADDKEIVVVALGSGKRASRYRRPVG